MVEWSAFFAKFLGALTGSSIAVALQAEGETKRKTLNKLGVGLATGVLFSAAVLSYYEIEPTEENLAAAAGALGIIGYALLKIVMAEWLDKTIRAVLPNLTKGEKK